MFAVTCLIISIEGTKIVKEDVKDFWKILLQKLSIGFIAVMVYCLFTDAAETMLKTRFYSKITTNNESLSEKTSWIHCIEDIQEKIMTGLSKEMRNPDTLVHPSPVLLIDPSYHANVGDSLISYGEVVLIERMGYMNHTECSILQSYGKSKKCGDFSSFPNGGLALWQGGGNWGDLWFGNQRLRRLWSFIQLAKKGRTIIGMPQSLHYNNQLMALEDALTWMKNVSTNFHKQESLQKIVLTWRQENSFQKASDLYPFIDNRLIPDVAFMIGPISETNVWNKDKSKVDILFALRKDYESRFISQRNESYIRSMLDAGDKTKNITFKLVDWDDAAHFCNSSLTDPEGPNFTYKVKKEGVFAYQPMFRKIMSLYSSGKVVITDRLHMSIFAVLLHKPHVVLDQIYGKISNTRNFAFKNSKHCENKDEMRYEKASALKEAALFAVDMIEKWSL